MKTNRALNVFIILFPEMTLTGFTMNLNISAQVNDNKLDFFKELCIKNGVNIGFGWVKRVGEKGENHYTIIDKNGNISSDYIKIHPFPLAKEEVIISTIDIQRVIVLREKFPVLKDRVIDYKTIQVDAHK